MSYLFCNPDRVNSKLDRDYATQAGGHLCKDCGLWNGSVSNSTSEKHDAFALSENNRERCRAQQLKGFVQPRAEFWRYGLAILNFRSALDWGRANRPDLPIRAVSRVKSSRGSGYLFRRLACRYRGDRFELLREHQKGRIQVDEAPGVCAQA